VSAPPRTAYRLETPRLVARCWTAEDAPAWRAALDASDAFLRPWIPYMKGEPRSLDETAEWLRTSRDRFERDEMHRYGMFTPDGGTVLGEVCTFVRTEGATREIGYMLDVRQAGRGYATEGAGALVRLAFEHLGEPALELGCAAPNTASIAVAERLGFSLAETLPGKLEDTEGEYHDLLIWSLAREDYPGTRASELELRALDKVGRRLL
jgi:ribosomal-protein-alanine N-acetyltransferase